MSSTPLPVSNDGASAGAKTGFASNAPVVALCCLLCLLFLVASTIVLALIPVYLPTKSAGTAVSISPYATLSQNGVPNYGAASSDACSAIANGMNTAGGYSSGSISSTSCSFVSSSGRRRRAWHLSRKRRQVAVFCVMKLKVRGHSLNSLKRKLVGLIFSATFFYFGITYTIIFTILGFSTSEPNIYITTGTSTTSTAATATSAAASG